MPVMLPPELVSLCFAALDPLDAATVPTLLSASLASTSFRALATAHSLWRPIADAHYHQYRPSSTTTTATSASARTDTLESAPDPPPPSTSEFDVDAYRYYAARAHKDQRARALVREIQRPTHRLPLMAELRSPSLGSDVIENRRWAPSEFTETSRPETWLSLRYWASECRKALLRDEALATWREIALRSVRGDEAPDDAERGLDAFAAFRGLDPARLARDRYDMRHHAALVDATRNPPYSGTARLEWLAREVVEYMRSIGLKPSRDGGFHSLDNHYVELVWQRADPVDGPQNEGTLPMTLVSIFCSLVRRLPAARALGIEARLIGYPGTVLAGLSYGAGAAAGGEGVGTEDRIYVNVFGQGKILTPERLRAMLGAMGQAESEEFLQPASAREIVSLHSVRARLRLRETDPAPAVPSCRAQYPDVGPRRRPHDRGPDPARAHRRRAVQRLARPLPLHEPRRTPRPRSGPRRRRHAAVRRVARVARAE